MAQEPRRQLSLIKRAGPENRYCGSQIAQADLNVSETLLVVPQDE
jgi:hypothetical protein